MADRSDSGSRPQLSVTTPHQISKDFQGAGNPIPLSPQWLLPKPGESKPVIGTGENNSSLQPANGNRSDIPKTNGEVVHDISKKKDVFRPSLLDMDNDKRGRWRDEERDTSASLRKDRLRDGEKDLGDNRRMDRWTDNSSGRHFGESRRVPSERRTDSSNIDANYDQRRESKWNTRWGPEDKETEGLREKWVDSERDGDTQFDKGSVHVVGRGKDDKEGDHYRPWRSSAAQSRGRGAPHHQTLMPNKQGSTFSYGRGRGENTPPSFSVSRGRVSSIGSSMNYNSSPSQFLGVKYEGGHGEPLKYARTKLLDLYRTIDMRSYQNIADGFMPVPSLTLDEPIEPFALHAPNPEEMTVLKGIDKGDAVSSGAPQISKDARNSSDIGESRRNNLGSREDLPYDLDECTEENTDTKKVGHINFSDGSSSSHEKDMLSHGFRLKMETIQDNKIYAGNRLKPEASREDTGTCRKENEVPALREPNAQGILPVHPGATWQTSALGDHSHSPSLDWREDSSGVSSRTLDKSLFRPSKDLNDEWQSNLSSQTYTKDNTRRQIGDDPIIKRQLSGIFDKEQQAWKLSQSSPEDLRLYYKDPSGLIQGPFAGIDIIGWFEGGYFGLDLPVRREGASNDSPFASLGDVMPHLRAKAKPPPGFAVSKPNEHAGASTNLSFSGFGQLHGGLNEMDAVRNETRHKYGSTTEAENRFLESLMSGSISSTSFEKAALSEGLQGFYGNNSNSLPPFGVDGGNNVYLLAKRMALERQKSLPSPHQYWQGGDAAAIGSKSEIVQDSLTPHSKFPSSVIDNHRQSPYSQSGDMLSILQGLSDRPQSGIINNTNWSNFAAPDPLQNKIDLHHDQNFPSSAPFGIQPQQFQLQKQPSLKNILSQTVDNSSGPLMQEKLLSSNLSQDPQLLNMLQQQYLLQLQSQTPFPTQQMSLLDKLLVLKQQQKQEEQQQLLRQQQLLSQVLSEHQSHQQFAETSFGQLQAAPIPMGTPSVDLSRLQPSQEMLLMGTHPPGLNVQGEHASNFRNSPLQVTQDATYTISPEGLSFPLPHQMFGNIGRKRSSSPILQANDIHQTESLPIPKVVETSLPLGTMNRSSEVPNYVEKSDSTVEFHPESLEQASGHASKVDEAFMILTSKAPADSIPLENTKVSLDIALAGKFEISVAEDANGVKTNLDNVLEVPEVERNNAHKVDSTMKTEVENVEVREPRKASEKKSKKQKSSKPHSSSDQGKGVPESPHLQQSKRPEDGKPDPIDFKLEPNIGPGENLRGTSPLKLRDSKDKKTAGLVVVDSKQVQDSVSESFSRDDVQTVEVKGDPVGSQVQTGQRAWKPAPGFKAKSLLEIQEEEQKRAQTEVLVSEITTSVNSTNSSTPWAGVVSNSDQKAPKETQGGSGRYEAALNSKSKTSQLHDLLGEEVLSKPSRDVEVSESVYSVSSPMLMTNQSESVDEGSFIETKDTKKSRKKSLKAKGAVAKASVPIASVDLAVASTPIEKGKISRPFQPEKEVMPAIPSGPSLGDFVLWKGESTNPSPSPAWSTDSGKFPKPTCLRDIQKEQERRMASLQSPSPMPTPQKSQPTQIARSNTPSWSLSASSPSKASSPIQINTHASSQSKYKGEDELFWGPIDQSKQESQQVDFPHLASQNSRGIKNSPGKGIATGSLSRQKSVTGKASESFLSPPASAKLSTKGKRDSMTKHSEAMDFRDWCETECFRLIGSKDMSFLEFCLKQSRSEAELLLIENLGTYDPDHKFIDKFLNYKELLPADVLDIAFQSQNDRKSTRYSAKDVNSENVDAGDVDNNLDGYSKGGGKKKGKKGKKVSASILGFNVVSNRIMMGEIQTVED